MLFTLLLALKVDLQAGKISQPEVLTFIKGHTLIIIILFLSFFILLYLFHSCGTPTSAALLEGESVMLLFVCVSRWSLFGSELSGIQTTALDPGSDLAQPGAAVQPTAILPDPGTGRSTAARTPTCRSTATRTTTYRCTTGRTTTHRSTVGQTTTCSSTTGRTTTQIHCR